MWMVDPQLLCKQHLLGEHLEIHMFMGSIARGCSIFGYLTGGLLETHHLYSRHEELVKEMKRRGYQHKSPVDEEWKDYKPYGKIDVEANMVELSKRCERCRKRIDNRNV